MKDSTRQSKNNPEKYSLNFIHDPFTVHHLIRRRHSIASSRRLSRPEELLRLQAIVQHLDQLGKEDHFVILQRCSEELRESCAEKL